MTLHALPQLDLELIPQVLFAPLAWAKNLTILVAALLAVTLDPAECRASATERFSPERMGAIEISGIRKIFELGRTLKNATMSAVTEKGSVDLGTYAATQRYKLITIPATGVFRPGLRDTVIRRFLQPINAADTSLDSLRIIVIATDSLAIADTATRRIDSFS
jgi:Cu/Ag efflux pump CusA